MVIIWVKSQLPEASLTHAISVFSICGIRWPRPWSVPSDPRPIPSMSKSSEPATVANSVWENLKMWIKQIFPDFVWFAQANYSQSEIYFNKTSLKSLILPRFFHFHQTQKSKMAKIWSHRTVDHQYNFGFCWHKKQKRTCIACWLPPVSQFGSRDDPRVIYNLIR